MSSFFSSEKFTKDDFLSGRISLIQPKKGYRANIDSVLLASAVSAKPNQSVLELGCGVGTTMFCLKYRLPSLKITGIEIQKKYAILAKKNSKINCLPAEIYNCDINSLPEIVRDSTYDHVVFNPPFYEKKSAGTIQNNERDIAMRESTPDLNGWLNTALRRCKQYGKILLIHETGRLDQILNTISDRVGDIKILPILPYIDKKAKRVMIEGCKGSSGVISILPPLILHENKNVLPKRIQYTEIVENILRTGNKLPFF